MGRGWRLRPSAHPLRRAHPPQGPAQLSPQHKFLLPGEGDFDYERYLQAMAGAGYAGFVTVEISKMVQHRPGYEP